MKKTIGVALLSALAVLTSQTAFAQSKEYVEAPVVNTVASYTWQRQLVGYDTQCRDVYIQQQQGRVLDGASGALKGDGDSLVGSIIGGVIGNQFGSGNGKTAMTVLGTIVGSNIGNGTSKQNGGSVKRTICDEVPVYERVKSINGYQVTYSFEGKHYTAFMQQDPGTHVTLRTRTTHTVKGN